jgi:hypothetical protein
MIRFGIIWVLLMTFHPVHVSLGSLEFDERNKGFSLFIKLYADDLENDCRLLKGNSELLLYTDGYNPSRELLHEYFADRLEIVVDNKHLTGEIGEVDSDAEEVRVTLRYKYTGRAGKIKIVNRIMTGLFDDQANLFIVRIGDWEEGIKFTPEVTEHIIIRGKSSY